MAVFYILLVVPIIIQHSRIKGMRMGYERKNKIALAFFFIFLTLLIMLRHDSVGNDTRNYMQIFRQYSRVDWNELWREDRESGYVYITKLISVFSRDPQFYLAAAAILVSAMIYPTYKRLCIDTALTIALFCILSTFVMMFSGIRQMIAIGIGFIAYESARQKKLILFILSVLVAMSIHTSAFMLAFMYPLYHARITKKWLYAVVPILALCFVFNRQIFGALSLVLEQYTEYDTEITSTGAYTMLILFGIFTVFSFLIPDENKMDAELIGLRNFLLIAFALQMFAPLHTLAMRMGYYYMIFIPVLLPKIVEYRSRRWNQVAILSRHVMVVFFLLYFFVTAPGGGLNVFPYHFFWERV